MGPIDLQGTGKEDEYSVVKNSEGQFSIWLLELPLPEGWQISGFIGKKQDCLDYIRKEWRDMRPFTLQCAEQRLSPQKSERIL